MHIGHRYGQSVQRKMWFRAPMDNSSRKPRIRTRLRNGEVASAAVLEGWLARQDSTSSVRWQLIPTNQQAQVALW
ncbi:hypothetical protein TWF594_005041 [Orbilia oligospora]|nr:hypothetical protein TWF594_005041 [Orbilia oligospora]